MMKLTVAVLLACMVASSFAGMYGGLGMMGGLGMGMYNPYMMMGGMYNPMMMGGMYNPMMMGGMYNPMMMGGMYNPMMMGGYPMLGAGMLGGMPGMMGGMPGMMGGMYGAGLNFPGATTDPNANAQNII